MEAESVVVESVGLRLRRLRRERGLSQRELAGPAVSYSHISRIEAGARRPSARVVGELAARLGVTPEYLASGRDWEVQTERELRLADAELELRLGGDLERAAAVCAAVLAEAAAAGDRDAVVRARVALGLAAAQRGDHPLAVEQLEQALASAAVSPLAHPDLYATLARSYAALDAPERAVALLERCLQEVREHPHADVAAEVRFATYLSYALSDLGEVERAREVVGDTLARARAGADPYSRVRLYWSLARLSLLEGRAALALRQIERAIALLEATEDSLHLARAHLSCGEILLENEHADEAESHLTLAEHLLGRSADTADLGWLRAEQARCAGVGGHPEAAVTLAREALTLLGESDSAHRAHAWSALAEAHTLRGESEHADEALAQAGSLLELANRPADAARLAQKRAKLLRAAGRPDQALELLERATDLALQAQTTRRNNRRNTRHQPLADSKRRAVPAQETGPQPHAPLPGPALTA